MIPFSKAHACGNDFLIVQQKDVLGFDLVALSRALCARTTGVGADGVEYLTIHNEREGAIRLYNADGSTAEISGNGTRCVAAWMAHRAGLAMGGSIRLQTDAGLRTCELRHAAGAEYRFTTAMGVPQVHAATVRLSSGLDVHGAVVSTGNPHFVIEVADKQFTVAGCSWQEIGAAICTHRDFPEQTNVEFVYRLDEGQIEIRIYERGVGPTTSSGTGTSASAAAMIALAGMPSLLRVLAPGGEQQVEWRGPAAELLLTGPAIVLFEGSWLAEPSSEGHR